MSEPPLALEEWRTALEFLSEGERHPADTVPRMVIHAAYYAIFHGARAVLVKLEGDAAPKKHNLVVGRFGYHAKKAGDLGLMVAGRAMNTVQEVRERSDFDTGRRPQPATADTMVKEARLFLETCARVHGFPPP